MLLKKIGDPRLFDETKVSEFYLNLQNSNLKIHTKTSYWVIFRAIIKMFNSSIDFSKFKTPRGRSTLPEILSIEEVNSLIAAASNPRNRAVIAVLYESGCRCGEMMNIKIKDINFDDNGAVIVVDGKTGMRPIRLVRSVPALKQYLGVYSFVDENSPLFHNPHGAPLSYNSFGDILQNTAQRAGIVKRIYPHIFRHTRATHLAKHLTEQELKVFFGWTGNSEMAGTYVHLSGRDIEQKILEINGKTALPKIELTKNEPTNFNGGDFERFLNFLNDQYKKYKANQSEVAS